MISAIPALVSSIIAYAVSVAIGVVPERFEVHSVPDIGGCCGCEHDILLSSSRRRKVF